MKINPVLKRTAAALALSIPLTFGLGSTALAAAETVQHVAQDAPEGQKTLNDIDNSGSEAMNALKSYVAQEIQTNRYELDGGGYVQGSDVLRASDGQVNSAIYNQLSPKSQTKFVADVVDKTRSRTDPNHPEYSNDLARQNGVDETTASNWFKELRNNSGIGSRMLTATLKEGVYADLSTGSRWFKPFSGPLSSFLGFMAITVISLMGIRSIVDLSYIAIPYFQSAMERFEENGFGSGGNGGGGKGFKVVSDPAKKAVQEGESGSNPIWAYFKKAAAEYVFLALAILFLCFNYMWDLAGLVLDFGTGFMGYS